MMSAAEAIAVARAAVRVANDRTDYGGSCASSAYLIQCNLSELDRFAVWVGLLMIGRRDFAAALVGMFVAWPNAAHGQQTGNYRPPHI